MGSLRTPTGPLPASVYWRRRAVALTVLVLLVLLVVWAVNLGGGSREDRGGGNGGSDGGRGPTDAITPGPSDGSGSEPPVDDRPGGRDEVDGGAGNGGAGNGGSGSGDSGAGGADGGTGSTGDGGDGGAGAPGGAAQGGSGGGALAGSGGGLGGGDGVPAAASLRDCDPGRVSVELRSVDNEFGPKDKPELELEVKNDSASACKVDLGREAAVLTITRADDDRRVWASDDCPPARGAAYVEVPARGTSTHRLEWDRVASAPGCGKADKGLVKADTYLAEVEIAGAGSARATFVLTED